MNVHLTNSGIMRLAQQIETNFDRIDEYARRIEQSDHPLKERILEELRENGIFYIVDVVDIVRKVLEEERP